VNELSCKELVELVTEYLEGALPPNERLRFEQHVQACEGCSAHLGQMRRTIELLGQLSEEALSPAAERELLAAFRTWKTG
jgi:anti-sigma factor RsiW